MPAISWPTSAARGDRYHANFGLRFVNTQLTIDNGQTAAVPTYYGTASWNGVDFERRPRRDRRATTSTCCRRSTSCSTSPSSRRSASAQRASSRRRTCTRSASATRTTSRARRTTGPTSAPASRTASPSPAGHRATRSSIRIARRSSTRRTRTTSRRGGLISVAGFYKQVDNFVETQNIATLVNDDFGGTTANVSKPVNAGKGKIYGIELGAQYAFNDTDHAGSTGSGFAVNYTRFGIRISDQATVLHQPFGDPRRGQERVQPDRLLRALRLLAPRVLFVARQVGQRLAGRLDLRLPRPERRVARLSGVSRPPTASSTARSPTTSRSNIGVIAQVQNLTDAVQHTYLQYADQPFTYDRSGRRYWLGVKFKL